MHFFPMIIIRITYRSFLLVLTRWILSNQQVACYSSHVHYIICKKGLWLYQRTILITLPHSAIIFISCLFTRYLAIICQFFFYRTPRYGARLCRQHKLNLAGSVLVFQFCVVLNLAFIKEGMGDTLRRVAKYKQTMTSVQREIRVCPEVWYIGDPTLYEQT